MTKVPRVCKLYHRWFGGMMRLDTVELIGNPEEYYLNWINYMIDYKWVKNKTRFINGYPEEVWCEATIEYFAFEIHAQLFGHRNACEHVFTQVQGLVDKLKELSDEGYELKD